MSMIEYLQLPVTPQELLSVAGVNFVYEQLINSASPGKSCLIDFLSIRRYKPYISMYY